MSDAAHPSPNYLAVFGGLCLLTGVSWLLDEANGWGWFNGKALLVTLVLAVAVAKALFVIVYFMHLKFEGRWKYVLLTPTAILAVGLPIALAPDLSMSYYESDTVQEAYLRRHGDVSHGGAAETSHGPAEATETRETAVTD